MTHQHAVPGMTGHVFVMLSLAYALASVQFWMTVPLAAIALAERGVPPWQIGLVGSVPWLTIVLLVPFVPQLAGRIGPVAVLKLGVAVALVGALLFLVSHSITLWVVGYALTGAGIAMRWIVTDALVSALAPEGRRGHRVGLFEMVVGGSMALGPLVLTGFGAHGTGAFLIGVGLVAGAGVLVFLIVLPPIVLPTQTLAQSFASIAALARKAPFALLAAAVCGLMEGASTKIFPVQAIGMGLGESIAAATGVAIGAGNLFVQYPIGRFGEKLGPQRVGRVLLLLAIGTALAIPSLLGTPVAYLLCLTLLGGIAGGFYTLSVIDAGANGSVHDAMALLAGISVAYTSGSVLGPIGAGVATSLSLAHGLTGFIVVIALATLLAFWRWPQRR